MPDCTSCMMATRHRRATQIVRAGRKGKVTSCSVVRKRKAVARGRCIELYELGTRNTGRRQQGVRLQTKHRHDHRSQIRRSQASKPRQYGRKNTGSPRSHTITTEANCPSSNNNQRAHHHMASPVRPKPGKCTKREKARGRKASRVLVTGGTLDRTAAPSLHGPPERG